MQYFFKKTITSLTIKGTANWLLLAVAQVNVPVPRFSYPVVRKDYTLSAPCRAKQVRQTWNVTEHEANSLSHQASLPSSLPKLDSSLITCAKSVMKMKSTVIPNLPSLPLSQKESHVICLYT